MCAYVPLHFPAQAAHTAQTTTAGQDALSAVTVWGFAITASHRPSVTHSTTAVCYSLAVQPQLSPSLHSFLHFALLSSVPAGPVLPLTPLHCPGEQSSHGLAASLSPITLLPPLALLLL